MNGAETIAETPLLGEAALNEAFARLGRTQADLSADGTRTAPRRTRAHAEPPPKTIAQLLGEITWLMTQSPRHRALALGDLDWLVMPAILLRQFRISIKASSRSASRYGRWRMIWWRNGSTPATSGWQRWNGRAEATCA